MLHKITGVIIATVLAGSSCNAVELLTNGDFELGFTGWTTDSQALGDGAYSLETPGQPTANSAHNTPQNLLGGAFYAASDIFSNAGSNILAQTFTVPSTPFSIILTFQMFVDNYSGSAAITDNTSLDYTAASNQHTRVDILSSGAGLFDTGGTVLETLYIGADPAESASYTSHSYDITSVVSTPGDYILRFATIANQDAMTSGVDNVSVNVVPEPSSFLLLLGGPTLLLMKRRSRRNG